MDKNYKAYLEKVKFDIWLKKIIKRAQNKQVIIYGIGNLFQYIYEHYDLSKLNIIGLSDIKFDYFEAEQKCFGFRTIKKNNIVKEKPDIILIGAENYVDIILNFENNSEYKKIEILPLIKKPLGTLIKELWRR